MNPLNESPSGSFDFTFLLTWEKYILCDTLLLFFRTNVFYTLQISRLICVHGSKKETKTRGKNNFVACLSLVSCVSVHYKFASQHKCSQWYHYMETYQAHHHIPWAFHSFFSSFFLSLLFSLTSHPAIVIWVSEWVTEWVEKFSWEVFLWSTDSHESDLQANNHSFLQMRLNQRAAFSPKSEGGEGYYPMAWWSGMYIPVTTDASHHQLLVLHFLSNNVTSPAFTASSQLAFAYLRLTLNPLFPCYTKHFKPSISTFSLSPSLCLFLCKFLIASLFLLYCVHLLSLSPFVSRFHFKLHMCLHFISNPIEWEGSLQEDCLNGNALTYAKTCDT